MDNLLKHEKALKKAVQYFGTQKQLGEALGVSQQRISYWMRMGSHIKHEIAWEIVLATKGHVPIDELRPDVKKLNKKMKKKMLEELIVNEEAGDLEVAVTHIKVNGYVRKQLGDIEGLAEDIRIHGLIYPISVTDNLTLVCGARRLAAYRLLGRERIPVRFVPRRSKKPGGYAAEGVCKALTPSERVAIGLALENKCNKRQGQRTDLALLQNFVEVRPLTVSTLAKEAGFGSRETYRQAKSVIEKGTPALIQAMDDGVMAISTAALLATLPHDEQNDILRGDKKDIIRAVRRMTLRQRRHATPPHAYSIKRVQVMAIPIEEIVLKNQSLLSLPTGINQDTAILDHPILVDTDKTLIAGHARLAAYHTRGHTHIPAMMLNTDALLQGSQTLADIAPLITICDRVALGVYLETRLGDRQGQRNDLQRKNEIDRTKTQIEQKNNENKPQLTAIWPEVKGETVAIVAKILGFGSRNTYRRAKKVVLQGTPSLIQAMNRGDVAPSAAATILTLSPTKQIDFLEKRKKRRSVQSAL